MSYTDGMTQNPDGGYTGSVGISLSQQEIEQGEYTGGMLDTLEANEIISTATAITQMGATNLLASNNLKLLMESESIKATLKGSEMVKDSNILLSKVVTNMATSLNESFNNSLMVNAIILGELQSQTEAMNNLIQTIKDKQIEFNANSISMGNLSVDTAPIVQSLNTMAQNQSTTNTKIVEGIENQKETNAKIVENITKKNEHLDFLKNGDSNVKDSSGNVIKPREIEAKKNAEQFIEQKDTNETDFNDIEDFVNWALGIVYEVTDTLGATDGFSLFVNPLEVIDRILVEDYINNQDGEKQ